MTGTDEQRATIQAIAAALGDDVLRAVVLADPMETVTGVRIHESYTARAASPGEILIAIDVEHPHQLAALLEQAAARASAVAIKCPVDVDARLITTATTHDCTLLIVHDGVDWLHVIALVQTAIAEQTTDPLPSNWAPGQQRDLFELADLAAAGVGGPVTIEDQNGWLLAYSSDQQGGDAVRAQTLMSRRSPTDFTESLRTRGVTRQLGRSAAPLVVADVTTGVADRLAISLRAANLVVGTMWAVVTHPDESQVAAFAQVAHAVALRLLQRQAEDFRANRVEMEQLAVLLHGGPAVSSSGGTLTLPAGVHWVAALSFIASDSNERALTRSRLEQRLFLMQHQAGVTIHAGQLSNLWWLIITTNGPDAAALSKVNAWLDQLVHDTSGGPLALHIGIGSGTPSQLELPRSRKEAERALAVARLKATPSRQAFEVCWAQAALIRVLDTAAFDDLDALTPLRRLLEHDAAHGSDYLPTLQAWLTCQGNIRAAAEHLHIHTNTLRYRLSKLEAAGNIDLADADTRLVLSLQLRTASLRADAARTR